MSENIFGKQRGRFDEDKAKKDILSLIDQFKWNFAAMNEDMKEEAVKQFNLMFSHPHCNTKFEISKII